MRTTAPRIHLAWLLVLSTLHACNSGGPGGPPQCKQSPRLVPSNTREYQPNAQQFDTICLPEAWYFLKDKWQGLRPNISTWPTMVVIDDGFFATDDSGVRPEINPGYPDGTGIHPQGSA